MQLARNWRKTRDKTLPHDTAFDSTWALLSEGYGFTSRRCARFDTDIFAARVLLQPAIFMLGSEAAAEFYLPNRFTRHKAMPITTLKLLQDNGSVQMQNGSRHRQRKRMFMALMNEANVARLLEMLQDEWHRATCRWAYQSHIVFYQAVSELLCRAACRWLDLNLSDDELRRRTLEISAMIDGAGRVGPGNWLALALRQRTETWARQEIARVRDHSHSVAPDNPLYMIAWHREDGELLDTRIAAVELLNVLRPIVAVARFITFAALALHDYPECRMPLQSGDANYRRCFVQEVRRFYPFFPFIGGRVRQPFEWRRHFFSENTWVLLDLYGTNHDERQWRQPYKFEPERFGFWRENAFDLVPQGGGDYHTGHRCPGENATIALMDTAVQLLMTMQYDVPVQDLRVSLQRMPALPRSGFVMRDIRGFS